MKVRLCNKDVCNLVDMLRELPETLENPELWAMRQLRLVKPEILTGFLKSALRQVSPYN